MLNKKIIDSILKLKIFKDCKLPERINIYEVSARDGLQNEKTFLNTESKIQFINKLSTCGFKSIEVTSFVSPKWIPQFSDASDVFRSINRDPDSSIKYPVLIPNEQGMVDAMMNGIKDVAVFTAASETFCQKNLNCNIKDSLLHIEEIARMIEDHSEMRMTRGYISCALGCPYEGEVESELVANIANCLIDMGCEEVSISDTIGIGQIKSIINTFEKCIVKGISENRLAAHLHDTYGQALTNILIVLLMGIKTIDSSIAGLGGCPYAKGATGNVSTEDVMYMLDGLDIKHDLNWNKIIDCSRFICDVLNRKNSSKTGTAVINKTKLFRN